MTRGGGLPSPGDGIPEAVVEAVRERTDLVPTVAIVLGSGLDGAIEEAARLTGRSDGETFSYADLPGFPTPSVQGHAGRLWLGELGQTAAAVFRGRVHHYEGHPLPLAALPARVAAGLGARAIVLTAAVGSLDPSLGPGTIVVLRDHLNLMGTNALRGWRFPDGTPAFVDLSQVYDPELADAAIEAAELAGDDGPIPAARGVYAALQGPSYETPAETEYLRRVGATVVGMSVVPEAVAAHALGLRVLGLSFVTNVAGASVSHEEVLDASHAAARRVGRVLARLLERF
jgi:purine-nucleoside phosphorylase